MTEPIESLIPSRVLWAISLTLLIVAVVIGHVWPAIAAWFVLWIACIRWDRRIRRG